MNTPLRHFINLMRGIRISNQIFHSTFLPGVMANLTKMNARL